MLLTPIIRPKLSWMGAPLSSIEISLPFLETRKVWLARPTTVPRRRTLSTGFSTAARVSSLKPGAEVELDGRHARQSYKLKLTVLERPTRPVQQR